MTFLGDGGVVEFVDGGIHAAVDSEEIEKIGLPGLAVAAGAERLDVNVVGGFGLEAFVMHTADGEGGAGLGAFCAGKGGEEA